MAAGDGATEHEDVLDRPIDWERAEHSPEFQELVHSRRRFVIPATVFFLSWYLAFILLAGYAPDFMGESVYQGLTVGYCLALTQFLMMFVLGILYLRKSEKVFDPLSKRAAERALETDTSDRDPGRFSTTDDGGRDVSATTAREDQA